MRCNCVLQLKSEGSGVSTVSWCLQTKLLLKGEDVGYRLRCRAVQGCLLCPLALGLRAAKYPLDCLFGSEGRTLSHWLCPNSSSTSLLIIEQAWVDSYSHQLDVFQWYNELKFYRTHLGGGYHLRLPTSPQVDGWALLFQRVVFMFIYFSVSHHKWLPLQICQKAWQNSGYITVCTYFIPLVKLVPILFNHFISFISK